MKKNLTSLKEVFDFLASVSAIAVAIYGIIALGIWNALIFSGIALSGSVILTVWVRLIKQKEELPAVTLNLSKGEECTFGEYEKGFFQSADGTLCYKNEYNEGFIISSGEMFWGGAQTDALRDGLIIYPLAEDAAKQP